MYCLNYFITLSFTKINKFLFETKNSYSTPDSHHLRLLVILMRVRNKRILARVILELLKMLHSNASFLLDRLLIGWIALVCIYDIQ